MTPEEYEMTRSLVSTGAGDADYRDNYCETEEEWNLCFQVEQFFLFRNHEEQIQAKKVK